MGPLLGAVPLCAPYGGDGGGRGGRGGEPAGEDDGAVRAADRSPRTAAQRPGPPGWRERVVAAG